jgi:hypothetical protein
MADISDGQHRLNSGPKVYCVACKKWASVEIKCSCGTVRCMVCPDHVPPNIDQTWLDYEFGCNNTKCPKCDHELVEAQRRLKSVLSGSKHPIVKTLQDAFAQAFVMPTEIKKRRR